MLAPGQRNNVTAAYPRGRMLVRNLDGGAGLSFSVEYEGTNGWQHPRSTGQVHGSGPSWTLSDSVNRSPEDVCGRQILQITLEAQPGPTGHQIYEPYTRVKQRQIAAD